MQRKTCAFLPKAFQEIHTNSFFSNPIPKSKTKPNPNPKPKPNPNPKPNPILNTNPNPNPNPKLRNSYTLKQGDYLSK